MATMDPEERAELDARSSLIAMHQRTATLLESERRLFVRHLLTSKGLDPEKQYQLDPKTGEITEIEAEQKG